MKKENRFDNLIVNVPRLFLRFPISEKTADQYNHRFVIILKLYQLPLLPLALRKYLWYLLTRLNLDSSWFYEFKQYWEKCLHGVTLWGQEDFFFLRGVYRLKFHNLKLHKIATDKRHLMVWQKPEVLYFLLDMVYRESLYNDLAITNLYFQYRKKQTLPILEFGSGTAPVATTLMKFFNETNQRIYISDIQTLAFHYASYKFQHCKNVTPVLLVPENHFLPETPEQLGAIFCMTVFEHVNNPLSVAKKFYDLLLPGGILIFDYLKTNGEGMDSPKSVEGRNETLKFISRRFDIVHGNIWNKHGNETIVARKT